MLDAILDNFWKKYILNIMVEMEIEYPAMIQLEKYHHYYPYKFFAFYKLNKELLHSVILFFVILNNYAESR